MPEIPLSVGSKLELLLRAFVFAKFPYTSPYTHAFVRVSRIYVYMTEAPRILHFNAFVIEEMTLLTNYAKQHCRHFPTCALVLYPIQIHTLGCMHPADFIILFSIQALFQQDTSSWCT